MTPAPPEPAAHTCPQCGRPLVHPGDEAAGPGWRLWCGRSEELLPTLPSRSVDMICTDPPYGSGGDTRSARMLATGRKYVSSDASYQSTLPDFAGAAVQPEAWVATQTAVWSECARLLTTDGVFATFVDWRQAAHLLRILSAANMRVRGMVPWDKGPGARPMRGGFRARCEYVLWGSRGSGRLPRSDLYLPGIIQHAPMTGGKLHQTQKPDAVVADIIPLCPPGGLILDPFAGSGTTLVVGLRAGYRVHGIEQVPEIYATARDRVGRVWSEISGDTQ